MKIESKLFDTIRIRPRREDKPEPAAIGCDWEGCDKAGTHRAPKGHRNEGQYHNFCLEHVRHYNTAFNFFAGMDKDDLEEALHAPPKPEARTSFGTGQAGARASRTAKTAGLGSGDKYGDPFGVFAKYRHRQSQKPAEERSRPLHEPDRRALETLGILGQAKSDEIKKAYKSLVKLHHPDANGGDKSSEDRLRTIIAAYSHLKKAGFVAK
ncbi:J domain-containing protein [uncultured Devosia sp.]|uniref:J domain-containing protein n=1 Tax=uncultured Devosia sp. TaxID=211434 RepID=UPI0035CA3AC0